MLTAAVVCTIAFLAVFAAVIALCLWWRLERLADRVYRLGWDIDALAGALTRSEGYEAPERPDH
jgi:hypothetical protein